MPSQALDIADFQADRLGRGQRGVDLLEFAIGEDVPLDEGFVAPPAEQIALLLRAGPVGDGVVEEEAARLQRALHRREVLAEVRGADMLGHADAGRLVEPRGRQVAIVAKLHLGAVGQALRRDPLARQAGLRLGQGDAGGVHPVVGRRVPDQRPPAAADVQEALARAQAQLAADQVQLLLLGLVERRLRAGEIGARVDHVAIEPEPVEVVADVVVVADRLAVARPRVDLAAGLGPVLIDATALAILPAQAADQEGGDAQQVAPVRAVVPGGVGQFEDLLQVPLDGPVAVQVRLAEGQLIRVQEDRAEHGRRLQHEHPVCRTARRG